VYEGLTQFTRPNDVVAQANTQGARQFAFVGPITFNPGSINLYQRDTSASYQYESLPMPPNAAGLQLQLDAQGARGFAYYTPLSDISGIVQVIYVRDSLNPGILNYRVLPEANRSDTFLAQLNAQGSEGYVFRSAWFFLGANASFNIFQKDSTAASYSYALEPDVNSVQVLQTQLNARGQSGFRYAGPNFFPGAGSPSQSANLYVRDTTQSPTFVYELPLATTSSAALVSQANAQGARGFYYYSGLVLFPNGVAGTPDTRNVYVQSSNCTGSVMCRGIDGVF
jgi:hypothetical protein